MDVSPLHGLRLPQVLACEFLSVFARCEYALKASGFARGDETRVDANWDAFAQEIDLDMSANANPDVAAAIEYLLSQPPRKQVLLQGALEWRDAPPDASLPRTLQVLAMVRRVRNNLFHGGKMGIDPNAPFERDELLVRHSLVILHHCSLAHERLAQAYHA